MQRVQNEHILSLVGQGYKPTKAKKNGEFTSGWEVTDQGREEDYQCEAAALPEPVLEATLDLPRERERQLPAFVCISFDSLLIKAEELLCEWGLKAPLSDSEDPVRVLYDSVPTHHQCRRSFWQ